MMRIGIGEARRIALAAQGFCDPKPKGAVSIKAFRRALERMTILQLDSVNVLCRSHFLPMFARLGPYDRDKLDAWLWLSGENHEFISHEASITNMELYPMLRPRMKERRWKLAETLEKEEPGYNADVLRQIDARGPLSVRELEEKGKRSGPWWGRPKGKVCLEANYFKGVLSIRNRNKAFVTFYDLAERVIPEHIRSQAPLSRTEAHKEMLTLAAQSLGIGSDRDLADYFRLKMPVARSLIAELVSEEKLLPVQVEGWAEPAYRHPEARCPRQVQARALLSPFDPVVWFRPRAQRLFDFQYKIEIYVPASKRVYGYYVLPFLLGESIVARVDLKADRQGKRLLARGIFEERGVNIDTVAKALVRTLEEMAEWLGLDGVVASPGGPLAEAVISELE